MRYFVIVLALFAATAAHAEDPTPVDAARAYAQMLNESIAREAQTRMLLEQARRELADAHKSQEARKP
jgi:hypothetical protein